MTCSTRLTCGIVANLPAEIAHLLEEVEAKDKVIQECRNVIHTRDSSIQKHLKVNGAGHAHPKDDAYTKSILSNFDKAMGIQDEKVALSEKASVIVGILLRQVARNSTRVPLFNQALPNSTTSSELPQPTC